MLGTSLIWGLVVPTKTAIAGAFVLDPGTSPGIENVRVDIGDREGNHSHGSPYITDESGNIVQLIDCEWELVSEAPSWNEIVEEGSC